MTTAPTVATIRDRQARLQSVIASIKPQCIRPRSLGKRILSLYRAADLFVPELVSTDHRVSFQLISEQTWLRPLWAWDGTGGLKGLLMHLLITVRYPLPDFLFSLPSVSSTYRWMPGTIANRDQLTLLAHLGTGGTMRTARDLGLIPACLTRKMHHQLLAMEGDMTLSHAIRKAQFATFGGSDGLLEILRGTRLGQLQSDEHLWQPVIAWLCVGQNSLPTGQVGALIDWLFTLPPQDRRQRIRQPLSAALRRALEWHEGLHIRPGISIQPGPLPDSGIPEVELTQPWSMQEIPTGIALAAEGSVMRHCVATYWSSIMAKRSSIFSLRRDKIRQMTVEVRLAEGCVVQARGQCNRRPAPEEEAQIRIWATAVGLTVRSM